VRLFRGRHYRQTGTAFQAIAGRGSTARRPAARADPQPVCAFARCAGTCRRALPRGRHAPFLPRRHRDISRGAAREVRRVRGRLPATRGTGTEPVPGGPAGPPRGPSLRESPPGPFRAPRAAFRRPRGDLCPAANLQPVVLFRAPRAMCPWGAVAALHLITEASPATVATGLLDLEPSAGSPSRRRSLPREGRSALRVPSLAATHLMWGLARARGLARRQIFTRSRINLNCAGRAPASAEIDPSGNKKKPPACGHAVAR
jgi:hypothetical protein